MKKAILITVGVLTALIALGFLFRDPLIELAKDLMTQDMYVAQDTDVFDPGLAIGASFPLIQATYQGEVVTDISQFPIDKGMIFVANRSADW